MFFVTPSFKEEFIKIGADIAISLIGSTKDGIKLLIKTSLPVYQYGKTALSPNILNYPIVEEIGAFYLFGEDKEIRFELSSLTKYGVNCGISAPDNVKIQKLKINESVI